MKSHLDCTQTVYRRILLVCLFLGDNTKKDGYMSVKELIIRLQDCKEEKEVFISCQGGCVESNEITVIQTNDKVVLEIE